MYVVFARKYRPQRFEDVVGQQHVAATLQNAVRTGRVAHAYLFCGSRGVGKTTVARLLARSLNCKEGPTPDPCGQCESCRRIATGDDLDVMEIDGASNRGIDQVRDLRQNVRLAPSHSRFKVYYIDEVHMLTGEAFNALLKTLEEPPAHVKFIFSTTDPQKLPDTVKSRCQRFDFRRIADAEIVGLLQKVCAEEGLEAEPAALAAIARAARGSLRDALGTLDQLAAEATTTPEPTTTEEPTTTVEATLDDVLSVLGAVDRGVLTTLVDALAGEDTAGALRAAHSVLYGATDAEDFADQLSEYLRDLVVAGCCGAEDPLLAGAAADVETLKRQGNLFTAEQLAYMIQLLREAKLRARRDTTGRIAVELALIKMSRLSDLVPVAEALEGGGRPAPPIGESHRGRQARDAGAAPEPGAAPADAAAVQAHAGRIRQKLEAFRSERRPADEGPSRAAPPETPPPEGVDAVKYRQALSTANDAEARAEAADAGPLWKAFAQADKALGLHPTRIERKEQRPADSEPEQEQPQQDTTE